MIFLNENFCHIPDNSGGKIWIKSWFVGKFDAIFYLEHTKCATNAEIFMEEKKSFFMTTKLLQFLECLSVLPSAVLSQCQVKSLYITPPRTLPFRCKYLFPQSPWIHLLSLVRLTLISHFLSGTAKIEY